MNRHGQSRRLQFLSRVNDVQSWRLAFDISLVNKTGRHELKVALGWTTSNQISPSTATWKSWVTFDVWFFLFLALVPLTQKTNPPLFYFLKCKLSTIGSCSRTSNRLSRSSFYVWRWETARLGVFVWLEPRRNTDSTQTIDGWHSFFIGRLHPKSDSLSPQHVTVVEQSKVCSIFLFCIYLAIFSEIVVNVVPNLSEVSNPIYSEVCVVVAMSHIINLNLKVQAEKELKK